MKMSSKQSKTASTAKAPSKNTNAKAQTNLEARKPSGNGVSRKEDIRLGLCCLFMEEPIQFRTTTVTAMLRLSTAERGARLSGICLHNARTLQQAVKYCSEHGIGAFRILSQILPVKTHLQAGYRVADLPGGHEIIETFREAGNLARCHGVRLSFHPDQFVVLNSPNPETVARSLAELDYQAEVAEWVGADVINIHGGGGYGDKPAALRRLVQAIERLPTWVRKRLTLENDDTIFTPADLLPVCAGTGVPLVYDVHHHRCLLDGLSVETVTDRAMATWNREPLFHLSSPLEGWSGPRPERHRDYIDAADFPASWRACKLTVDVEAKAKELAVFQLQADLGLNKNKNKC
jgi:UV DNA damage endonuclease